MDVRVEEVFFHRVFDAANLLLLGKVVLVLGPGNRSRTGLRETAVRLYREKVSEGAGAIGKWMRKGPVCGKFNNDVIKGGDAWA